MCVLWGTKDVYVFINVVGTWTEELPRRAELSPPHVLVVEIGSGCWKAGCRSSRSLGALELLKGTSRKRAWRINQSLIDKPFSSLLSSKAVMRRKIYDCSFFPSNARESKMYYFCVHAVDRVMLQAYLNFYCIFQCCI